MGSEETVYEKVIGEQGETYYCPLEDAGIRRRKTRQFFDDCVETSTVGRYSGNIAVVE